MSDKIIENNQVTIMGEIVSTFTFSHEVFGEGFYMVDVSVRRLSNSVDRTFGNMAVYGLNIKRWISLRRPCGAPRSPYLSFNNSDSKL